MNNKKINFDSFFSDTETLAAAGNLSEAKQQLSSLIDSSDLIKARAYNDSGVIAYRSGNKDEALELYQQAVKLAPKEIVYRKNLADLCYFEFGDTQTALAHYRQILVDKPDDFDATIAIGRICADLGRHFLAEANEFFLLAERIEPDSELLAAELKKIKDCCVHSSVRENRFQSDHPGLTSDPHSEYQKLSEKFQPGEEENTEKLIQAFIKQNPDFGLAYNDLGVISHQLEKFEEAGKAYHEAVHLTPNNITFRKNLADHIFVIENDPETAMKFYHDILKDNPRDVETLMMIGNICLALDSEEEARNFFSIVLDIEPWNLDASKALEMLDQNRNKETSSS